MVGLETPSPWLAPTLVVLATLLVLLVVARGLLPLVGLSGPARAARSRIGEALGRGEDASRAASERALAYVEAGREALALQDRRSAARFARRAHGLDPAEPDVIALVIEAMWAARRYGALERALWASLDRARSEAGFERARRGLVRLYEGPLRRPERGRVLAGLRRVIEEPANVA